MGGVGQLDCQHSYLYSFYCIVEVLKVVYLEAKLVTFCGSFQSIDWDWPFSVLACSRKADFFVTFIFRGEKNKKVL